MCLHRLPPTHATAIVPPLPFPARSAGRPEPAVPKASARTHLQPLQRRCTHSLLVTPSSPRHSKPRRRYGSRPRLHELPEALALAFDGAPGIFGRDFTVFVALAHKYKPVVRLCLRVSVAEMRTVSQYLLAARKNGIAHLLKHSHDSIKTQLSSAPWFCLFLGKCNK